MVFDGIIMMICILACLVVKEFPFWLNTMIVVMLLSPLATTLTQWSAIVETSNLSNVCIQHPNGCAF